MARPLMQHGVAQLEQLFAKSKADPKVLKQLEHELQYRQVPRAVALLAEVQAATYLATPATLPAPSPLMTPANFPVRQPDLWERSRVPSEPLPPMAVQPQQAVPPTRTLVPPPTPDSHPHTAPAMSVEEAYKVLKATPGSAWESIEQNRRHLVQQGHPERLAWMSVEERARIQTEARRVNAAYAVLSRQRTAASSGNVTQ